jgi:hypothetical protein
VYKIACRVVTARGEEREQLGPEVSSLGTAKKMRGVWALLRECVQVEDAVDGRIVVDKWGSK